MSRPRITTVKTGESPTSVPGDPKYIHVLKSKDQSLGAGERLFATHHWNCRMSVARISKGILARHDACL
jgi:hypothetical protein